MRFLFRKSAYLGHDGNVQGSDDWEGTETVIYGFFHTPIIPSLRPPTFHAPPSPLELEHPSWLRQQLQPCREGEREKTVLVKMARRDSFARPIDVDGALQEQSICKDTFSTIPLVSSPAQDAGHISREEICSVRTLFLVIMSGKPNRAWALHVHLLFHSRHSQEWMRYSCIPIHLPVSFFSTIWPKR